MNTSKTEVFSFRGIYIILYHTLFRREKRMLIVEILVTFLCWRKLNFSRKF